MLCLLIDPFTVTAVYCSFAGQTTIVWWNMTMQQLFNRHHLIICQLKLQPNLFINPTREKFCSYHERIWNFTWWFWKKKSNHTMFVNFAHDWSGFNLLLFKIHIKMDNQAICALVSSCISDLHVHKFPLTAADRGSRGRGRGYSRTCGGEGRHSKWVDTGLGRSRRGEWIGRHCKRNYCWM